MRPEVLLRALTGLGCRGWHRRSRSRFNEVRGGYRFQGDQEVRRSMPCEGQRPLRSLWAASTGWCEHLHGIIPVVCSRLQPGIIAAFSGAVPSGCARQEAILIRGMLSGGDPPHVVGVTDRGPREGVVMVKVGVLDRECLRTMYALIKTVQSGLGCGQPLPLRMLSDRGTAWPARFPFWPLPSPTLFERADQCVAACATGPSRTHTSH